MLNLDYRYRQAKQLVDQNERQAARSEDELVQLLLKQKRGEPYVENALSRALEIYDARRQSKLILEALLIAPDTAVERIVTGLMVPKEVVEYYQKYFFDTSVFRDGLDVNDYISEIEDGLDLASKRLARTEGFYYILAKFSGGILNITPLEMNKRMQTFAYNMIRQADTARITSEAAKEAKHWAGIVKAYTDNIQKAQPVDNQKEFLAEFRVIFEKDEPIPDITKITGDVVRG